MQAVKTQELQKFWADFASFYANLKPILEIKKDTKKVSKRVVLV